MRLVVARCSVDYSGRLSSHLPSAIRLLMVKADGCVAIHADGGAYKPLNWMNAPNHLEKNLQQVLAERPWAIEEGLEMLEREYMTELGPVDLLCRDGDGQVVAVEIKRKGEIAGVEQLARYLEFLNKDSTLAPVRGILAAQSITPQARTLAAGRGIGCAEVDYDHLRGLEGMAPRLLDL
jgi:RecB family endonuclease NucS